MTSAALDRPASKSTHSRPSLFSGDIPRVALLVAAALVVLRISLAGFGLPLWLDENFSAAIAVQPTVHGLIDWCLNELSGPLYYSTLWAWEKVAGDSNAALRVPGHVIALATPLFLLWKGHPDREVRILWALMIGLWPLGFDIDITARPYAMVVFMGCVQAVAFLRLMEAPDTRRAALWAGASALAILTHYHALVITGIEGLIYLATWRMTALRTWRAGLVFVPVAGWMAFHLAMVLGYATSGQTWYHLVDSLDLVVVPLFLFGGVAMTVLVFVLLPIVARHRLVEGQPVLRWSPEVALMTAGLAATVIVVALGAIRPTFAMRYLLAYFGATSLIVPLLLRAARPLVPMAPLAAVLLLIGGAAAPLANRVIHPDTPARYAFNYQNASEWIMQQSAPRRLVFLWDNPTALLGHADKLADVGGFFFRRAGQHPEVVIPKYPLNGDPWPAVRGLVGTSGDSAVIWMADDDVPQTSKLTHPIGILHDANWNCRDFGLGHFTVLACVPHRASHP